MILLRARLAMRRLQVSEGDNVAGGGHEHPRKSADVPCTEACNSYIRTAASDAYDEDVDKEDKEGGSECRSD